MPDLTRSLVLPAETKPLPVRLARRLVLEGLSRAREGQVTLRLPDDVPAEKVDKGPFNASPSHGLGVAPDGKTLWVTSRPNARVYTYSLPDLKLLPNPVDLGGRPDWVTFTPDSKLIYITTENTDIVHAIDVSSRKEVAQIKVGRAPKRNITAVIG